MPINFDDLEDWAVRAGQAMQEIIDDAEAAGNGTDCCTDLRLLQVELDRILNGQPVWQLVIKDIPVNAAAKLCLGGEQLND